MKIYFLRTLENNLSEYEELPVQMALEEGRLVAGRLMSSDVFETAGVSFVRAEPGSDYGWHNARERMLVITLFGRLKVSTSGDDDDRCLSAGDVVLVDEKPEGEGHRSVVVSEEPWSAVFIRVTDQTLRSLTGA